MTLLSRMRDIGADEQSHNMNNSQITIKMCLGASSLTFGWLENNNYMLISEKRRVKALASQRTYILI